MLFTKTEVSKFFLFRIFIILFVLFFALFVHLSFETGKVSAANMEATDNVRVKLLDEKESVETIEFKSTDNYKLKIFTSKNGNHSFLGSSKDFILNNENGELYINGDPASDFSGSNSKETENTHNDSVLGKIDHVAVQHEKNKPIQLKNNQNVYRGEFKVKISGSGLKIVNILNMEDYLKGVVPAEMPANWDIEALKAQSVIARTYAAYQKETRLRESYHLTDSVSTQVYRGYSAEVSKTNEAVKATANEKLYHNGSLINALYHSNAGGETSDSEDVWGHFVSYLRSVESPWDEIARHSGSGEAYSWEEAISWKGLSQKLEEKYDIGELEEIEILDRKGDRVQKIRYRGTKDEKVLEGEKNREPLELRSAKFNIHSNQNKTKITFIYNQGNTETKKQSGKFYAVNAKDSVPNLVNEGQDNYYVKDDTGIRQAEKTLKYKFKGKGFGHGVGLSQWGALGMAQEGYNYQEILKHYYSGTIEIQ